MKKLLITSTLLLSLGLFTACSESDESPAPGDNLYPCKCDTEACENCAFTEALCDGNFLTTKSGVRGNHDGKNVVKSSTTRVSCGSKTCIERSQTEAACE